MALYTDGLFSFYDNPVYADIRHPEIYTGFVTTPEDQSHFTIRVVVRVQ